jgi:hypothetical protein
VHQEVENFFSWRGCNGAGINRARPFRYWYILPFKDCISIILSHNFSLLIENNLHPPKDTMLWRPSAKHAVSWSFCVAHLSLAYFVESPCAIILLRVSTFLFGWALRGTSDPNRWQDLLIFGAVCSWRVWKILGFASLALELLFPKDRFSIFINAATSILVILSLFSMSLSSEDEQDWNHTGHHPVILPCRTTHSRFFPEKHSFSYSYLQVSIPVEFEGRCGNLVSVGEVKRNAWLHVQASDYLDRSSKETNLKVKLTEYLLSQVN